jgi:phosphonate transport system substrate-binding protein
VGLIEAMGTGKVDIGSLPPLAYVLARDQNGAEVILKTSRNGSLTYHSMFVARADSGITSVEQAKGKRVAFTDPASAAGYLFPAAYLKEKGYDPENFFAQQIFAGGHDKAVIAVYNGDVDVAAVYDDARNKVEKVPAYKDVKQKVVKIGQTEEIPNDTISVRKGLSPELVAKIKAAFLKYAQSDEGKKTLMDVYEIDNLVEANDSDYDSVRRTAELMDVGLENPK